MAMTIEMPEHVDSITQILFWEVDEFGFLILVLGVSFTFHQATIGFVVSYFAMKVIKKAKNNALRNAANHALAATGLFELNKEFPNILQTDLFI